MLWGFDLGGTKIEGVVLSSPNPNDVIARRRVPTEADKGYEHVISQFKSLVELLTDEVGNPPRKIGVGTPGAIDPATGFLKNCNSQAINQRPFKADLGKALEIEITMANDANCFALAEAKMGAVKEMGMKAKVVFGVIMGTGVGGGIVVNGEVLNGAHGIAGEWGHHKLHEHGAKCYCGDVDCAELILSGPHLENHYEKISHHKKSLKDIYELFQAGNDPFANETMARLLHYFGLGLANVINILDPDVIVLGGGVSNLDILYTQGLEAVKKHVFNPSFNAPIIRPKLGDSAGVFGAALL